MNEFLFFAMMFSFVITFITVPYAIKKLSYSGKTVTDIYKRGNPEIPTNGAIVVFFTVIVICASWPLLNRIFNRTLAPNELILLDSIDMTILLVISLFAIFGIIDDLLDLSWSSKLFIPLLFSFPVFTIYNPVVISIPLFGDYDMSSQFASGLSISDIFKLLVIPTYIMVVPNLINMHSGFNGLQTGLSSILLATIIIKCTLDDVYDNLLVPCIFLGGIVAFWYYNKYPASIFEGNIGSLSIGSIIGITLVLKSYFFFGVFILLPHIIDFLMLLYLKFKNLPFIKFGRIDEDGILVVPNPVKMKFLFPYYYKMTEQQAVFSLYFVTTLFCVGGLILF
tara:strand:- start:990 stop:2000 length:1011 start_codon:yes stop_codon:yes gene_type:complete